ncbi:sensor domain-containing diguanylate cyclase [Balneatrix alpica]|uniref:diguanylate cyclase n=1 Tax=Balneatrix alpica TaxID=75684 RepID=A0ABV5ZAS0_9GAMM|nr:sensor domain-containing diguanylate cyclase [Balneatrix alpica]
MTKKLQILTLLCLILFGSFITTSLISYYSARDSLAREIEESTLPLTGDNIYSEIQRDLLRPIFISSLMAHDTFVRDWALAGEQEISAITRYLQEIQRRYETESSFFVSEQSRRYYHPQGVIKTIDKDDPQDAWYFNFKNSLEPYEINIDKNTANPDQLTVFINYKVYDFHGKLIGATGVGLSSSVVKQLIDEYQQRYNREIFFVDRLGNLSMHGDHYQGTGQLRHHPQLGQYATRILTSPSAAFHYDDPDGERVYVNSRLIPEFQWYLVVQQRHDQAGSAIYHTLIANLVGASLITLIVLGLVWSTVQRFQRRLETLAHTDKLTGLANRQMLDQQLPRILAQANRRQSPLCCVIADLDGFKQINDSYGHPVGDQLLASIARLFAEQTRQADLLCRWGGDEFLFILQDCDASQAQAFAEKLRQRVEQHQLPLAGQPLGVSLSLGVSQWQAGQSAEELIMQADRALLNAKGQGRNQVARLLPTG